MAHSSGRSTIIGTLNRLPDFPSKFVEPRNVDVWLPPGYTPEGNEHYPVVYMHDGQNLFDPETSNIGVDWGVDEAVVQLAREGLVPEAIVVGLWCTDRRLQEYMPQKAIRPVTERQTQFIHQHDGEPYSDNYLRFLVEEVKPYVDGAYRTCPGRESTFVMGSSMGGLISLYVLCEYPDLFHGAGCVSTHWPVGDGIVLEYLRAALPMPGAHRLYFDYGTETLDAEYEPFQVRADAIMQAAGYVEGRDWVTLKFPGAEHSERAWRERVHIPLRFLLTGQIDDFS